MPARTHMTGLQPQTENDIELHGAKVVNDDYIGCLIQQYF